MKHQLKLTIAAITLLTVFAGPAAAAVDVSKNELTRDVYSAIGSNSHVIVHEKDGVVTLSGFFNDFGDKTSATRAAKQTEGVVKVINLGQTSS